MQFMGCSSNAALPEIVTQLPAGKITDSPSRLLDTPCCTRIQGLLYAAQVRYANASDSLLVSESAA